MDKEKHQTCMLANERLNELVSELDNDMHKFIYKGDSLFATRKESIQRMMQELKVYHRSIENHCVKPYEDQPDNRSAYLEAINHMTEKNIKRLAREWNDILKWDKEHGGIDGFVI